MSCTWNYSSLHLKKILDWTLHVILVKFMHFYTLIYIYAHTCTSVFSSTGLLWECMMRVLFFWQVQHKSVIGFDTTTCGVSCSTTGRRESSTQPESHHCWTPPCGTAPTPLSSSRQMGEAGGHHAYTLGQGQGGGWHCPPRSGGWSRQLTPHLPDWWFCEAWKAFQRGWSPCWSQLILMAFSFPLPMLCIKQNVLMHTWWPPTSNLEEVRSLSADLKVVKSLTVRARSSPIMTRSSSSLLSLQHSSRISQYSLAEKCLWHGLLITWSSLQSNHQQRNWLPSPPRHPRLG